MSRKNKSIYYSLDGVVFNSDYHAVLDNALNKIDIEALETGARVPPVMVESATIHLGIVKNRKRVNVIKDILVNY